MKGLTQSEASSKPKNQTKSNHVKQGEGGHSWGEPSKRATHRQEDDDIQEVLPVKAEPLPSQLQQLDQFGGDTGQYEEEGFEHMDQYDDSAMVEGAGLEAQGWVQGRATAGVSLAWL